MDKKCGSTFAKTGWKTILSINKHLQTTLKRHFEKKARPCSDLVPWAGPQRRVYCCTQQLQEWGPGSLLEPWALESHWVQWGPLPSCWNNCRPSPRLYWWRRIGYIRLTRGQTFLKICQLWSLFIAALGTETHTHKFMNWKQNKTKQNPKWLLGLNFLIVILEKGKWKKT